MPLAVVIRSGTTPSWSQANQSPVRQKPVWISSATNTHAVARGTTRRARGRKPVGGDDEAALALDRLDHDAGDVVGADLLVDHGRSRGAAACSPVMPAGLAERVGHRRPVDLAGERPEAVLVGHVLGGHRHRQVGAAVVGVVEDRRPRRGRCATRAIFTAFSTASAPELNSADCFVVVARGELGQRLADVDVAVVRRDHEAGVGERARPAPAPGADHRAARVADAGHRDAGAEVDQRVAVDVDEHAAAGGRRRRPAAWCRRPSATCRPASRVQRRATRGPGISVTRRRSCGRSGPPTRGREAALVMGTGYGAHAGFRYGAPV